MVSLIPLNYFAALLLFFYLWSERGFLIALGFAVAFVVAGTIIILVGSKLDAYFGPEINNEDRAFMVGMGTPQETPMIQICAGLLIMLNFSLFSLFYY